MAVEPARAPTPAVASAGQVAVGSHAHRPGRRFVKLAGIGVAALPLLTLLDQALVSGGNFVTTYCLGKYSSDVELGLYYKGMSIVVLLLGLPMQLLWTPYNVYSNEMPPRRLSRYRASMLTLLLGIAAITVVSLAFFALFATPSVRVLLFALATASVAILLREHARRLAFASFDMKSALRLDMIVTGLQIAGLIALVSLGWLTGSRAYLVIGTACLLGALVMPRLWWSSRWPRLKRVAVDFKRNWRMSKYIFAGALLFAFTNGAYPWLLGYFDGDAAVGKLAAAAMAIFLSNPLLLAAANYFGPSMVRTNASSQAAGVYRMSLLCMGGMAALMFFFCVVMYCCGGWFVEWVLGSEYANLGLIVMSLAFSQVATAMLIPLRAGLFALDQGHLMVKGGLLRLFCMLTIGLYAVSTWGPLGVGIGMLSGDLAALVMKTLYLRRLALAEPQPRAATI